MGDDEKLVPPSVEILKGSALAMAQSILQRAMDEAGLDIAEVGSRMGYGDAHFLMQGDSQMNIKRFAHALAVCGFRPTFGYAPIAATWVAGEVSEKPPRRPIQPPPRLRCERCGARLPPKGATIAGSGHRCPLPRHKPVAIQR